jgi:hypothetical protein
MEEGIGSIQQCVFKYSIGNAPSKRGVQPSGCDSNSYGIEACRLKHQNLTNQYNYQSSPHQGSFLFVGAKMPRFFFIIEQKIKGGKK